MVDINLIGDDQTQFEPDENEKDFQDAYSADSGDFSQNEFMRNDSFDNADYTKVIRKSGSRAGVIVLFILVLTLLAVTAYILFKPAKKQRIAALDQSDLGGQIEAVPVEDTSLTPVEDNLTPSTSAVTEQPPSTMTTAVPVTILDRIARSYSGFNAINQLVNSIPPAINFTMITYSDGKVLFELMSEDETSLSDIEAVLQRRMPTANLQKLSSSRKMVKGRQYFQALVKGDISPTSTQPPVSSAPRFLDTSDIKQLLSRLCEQQSVQLLEVNQGVERIEEDRSHSGNGHDKCVPHV